MKQLTSKREVALKCKIPIFILASFSLLCSVLNIILIVINWFNYFDIFLDLFLHSHIRRMEFITDIFQLIYSALLIVFLINAKFLNNNINKIIITMWILIAIPSLLTISPYHFGDYYLKPKIFIVAVSIIAIISILIGWRPKIIVVIITIISICTQLYRFYSFLNIGEEYILYILCELVTYIGNITIYIALMLLELKNKCLCSLKKQTLSPERELHLLKNKYEFGQITEEEYQIQRAEIISRL